VIATLATNLLLGAAVVLAGVLALWRLSIRLRDVSIIDIAYALLVVAAVLPGFLHAGERGALQWLAFGALLAWALRLATHLARRNIGKGEDPRYTKLRAWAPDEAAFNRLSLRIVFLHQGVVIWLIALPLQAIVSAPAQAAGPFAWAGLAVWTSGFLCEAVADRQLARFRADQAMRGRILDTGLWRYSRHPNYFGNACLNWGLWLMACQVPWGFLSAIGPLAITHYLLNVTGKRLLEKKLLKEKPGYAEYVRRTSGFVPLAPRAPRAP
jgi:steroid 5-alpha reductase family enzyme